MRSLYAWLLVATALHGQTVTVPVQGTAEVLAELQLQINELSKRVQALEPNQPPALTVLAVEFVPGLNTLLA